MVITVVTIIMAVMWWQKNIHIQSNIFKLLPEISENQAVLNSYARVNAQLNNQVFVMLQSTDEQQLNRAIQQFVKTAQQSNLWQPIKSNTSLEHFTRQLFQYRTGLLSQQSRQLLQEQHYQAVLDQSMLQLLSPIMPLSAQMLKQDPLLLFPQFLMEKSQTGNAEITLEQGWATVHQVQDNGTEKIFRLVVLQTLQSPYHVDYQEKTSQWFTQVTQQFQQQNIALSWTGTLAFASYGTQSAQQEISTIGLGSSLGLVLLVLFGFRSLRPLLTEFIAVSTGSLMAFAVTHWIFGEIHLMTLVFGASLIGVCVDFSFYFMAMQSQYRNKNGFAILTPLLPSLFMGLMTTIIAYLFLSFTPFPAFRQISVFSMVGLLAAWITSILLLPRLPALNAEPALKRMHFLGQLRNQIVPYAKRRYLMIGLVIVISAIGLSQLKFNDDIHNLQSVDAGLKHNDQQIRQLFTQSQDNDYFIVSASSAALTEQAEARLLTQLQSLQQQGQLGQFQAAGQWFNTVIQHQNIKLLQSIPQSDLLHYAQTMDLNVNDVLNWQSSLAQAPLLTWQQFKAHPLSQLVLSETERVVLLNGIHDRQALQALQTSQVHFIQPVYTLSEQFSLHRIQAQWLLLGAILSLGVILGVLYGKASILPLMLPVSLALCLTFAIQALLGVELNLFSIMGCFLILGIGVDYAIFYRHAKQHSHLVAMALFLCMMSTLLGFGLLALSHTYAIFCFGITVLCGVIFSFVFATCLTQTEDPQINDTQP